MFIKEIELINFQKHSHLVLDFTKGVNVIVGKTDVGKSCIIRAIKWVFFGEPQGEVVRKEGTKKTSVKVVLDNDVIVERIKSASKNAYKLTIGNEEKEFNAVGKTIPEEIQKVLKLIPISVDNESLILNVSDQISMPFLLDKSATFRMKLFNKLTGNNVIDKVFQSFNKDILQIGRDERSLQINSEELTQSLEETTKQKEKVTLQVKEFSTLYGNLKKKSERYQTLIQCQENLNKVDKELRDVNNRIKSIKLIKEEELTRYKRLIERFNNLQSLATHFKEIKYDLLNVDKELATLLLPKINLTDLRKKIDKFEELMELRETLDQIEESEGEVSIDLEEVENRLKKEDKNYRDLLRQIKVCPICKTKLTSELIEEIKL